MKQIIVVAFGGLCSIIGLLAFGLFITSHRTDPISGLIGMLIVLCGFGAYHLFSMLPMKKCKFCSKMLPHDMVKCQYCNEIQEGN